MQRAFLSPIAVIAGIFASGCGVATCFASDNGNGAVSQRSGATVEVPAVQQAAAVHALEASGATFGRDTQNRITDVYFGDRNCDADLGNLPQLLGIRVVVLGAGKGGEMPKLTDAGMNHLKSLSQLESLDITSATITDAGLEPIKGLTRLERLCLECPKITDEGLKHLAGLRNLRYLYLYVANLNGEGLKHLQGMTQLNTLELTGTHVNDASLASLRGMTALSYLGLQDTNLSNAAVRHLKVLTGLKQVELYGTQVRKSGLDELRLALPKCDIRSHATE